MTETQAKYEANGVERLADNPAVQTAKALRGQAEDGVVTLRSGYRVRFAAFPDMAIWQAQSRIPDPPVPQWRNPDKDRLEPNPSDPDYQQALAEAQQKRTEAAQDIALLFGVELVDPLPDDDRWLRRLARIGIVVDAEDAEERELAFLKYVVFANSDDFQQLMSQANVGAQEVQQAMTSFPGDAARPAD